MDALQAEIRRLRDCIVSARWRLTKGRALWNGPCHECDVALERALTGREPPADTRRAVIEECARWLAPNFPGQARDMVRDLVPQPEHVSPGSAPNTDAPRQNDIDDNWFSQNHDSDKAWAERNGGQRED